jgi:ribonuclease HII
MRDNCYPWQQQDNGFGIEQRAYMSGYELIGGVDEAGRGPLAGPIVASVVILPKDVIIPGINDSKRLTPQQREKLSKIIADVAIDWGVGIVSHEIIDKTNILQSTYLAIQQAISKLRVSPSLLLVDGNFKIPGVNIYQYSIPQGDTISISIQAASIISKVVRDKIMMEYDAIYPEYGFAKHKGYGTKLHIGAIKEYGICNIHRRTYSPIKELLTKKVCINNRRKAWLSRVPMIH